MPISHLSLAYEEIRGGRFAEAELLCAQILTRDSSNVAALLLSAEVALKLKEFASALQRARSAAQVAPADANCRCTLADVYMALGRQTDAIVELRAARELAPGNASIRNRLIAALMRDGRLEEGAMHFRNALASDPSLASNYTYLVGALASASAADEMRELPRSGIEPRMLLACNAFGHALNGLGKVAPSARVCRGGQILDRTCISVYVALFQELLRHRLFADALDCVRALAAVEPENSMAVHWVAALSGLALERASTQYCEQLFDRYASQFDESLVKQLHYAVPEELADLARSVIGSTESRRRDILDLGCGTGLAGVAFAAIAKTLVGVDLSAEMLKQAERRQVYSRLEKADVVDFLSGESTEAYDLVLAADLFVYIGRLDCVFTGMRQSLRRHGVALFSIEALEATELVSTSACADYALALNGRFAHSRDYIEALACERGFSVERVVDTVLRTERGKPVLGSLYALRRE